MVDVAEKLIADITELNNKLIGTSTTIRALSRKLNDGTMTYAEAFRFAQEVGNIRRKTIKNTINSDVLPDGHMYWNIAERVTNNSLQNDYKIVANASKIAQKNKNIELGIGLNPLEEEIDDENIKNIAEIAASAEKYDEKSKLYEISMAAFAARVVSRCMEKNARYQHRIGVIVYVIRDGGAQCCEWCADKEGTYNMDDAPSDIFAKHQLCKCNIDYQKKR